MNTVAPSCSSGWSLAFRRVVGLFVGLALLCGAAHDACANNATWTNLASATYLWTNIAPNATGWSPNNTYPDGIGQIASNQTVNIANNVVLQLQKQITLGGLILGDTSGANVYSLQVGTAGSLVFDVASGSAVIQRTSAGTGIDQILVDTTINDDLIVTNATGGVIMTNLIEGVAGRSLTKNGVATLILNGAMRYSGATTVNAGSLVLAGTAASNVTATVNGGVLRLSTAGILGSSPGLLTLAGGVVEGTNAYTSFTQTIGSSAGNIQLTGGASGFSAAGQAVTVNLSGGADITWGGTTFNPSPLILNDVTASAALTLNNNIDLNGGSRVINVNASTSTVQIIKNGSGTGHFAKGGSGVLVLGRPATYNGNTTITGGVLRTTAVTDVPTSGVITNSGAIWETAGTISHTLGTAAGNISIPGGASGFSALGGALTLNFGGGTITWGSADFKPTTLILNAYSANNSVTLQNDVFLGGALRTNQVDSAAAYPATIAGLITGAAGPTCGLYKAGTGTLILGNDNNTYTGKTVIAGGVLSVANLADGGTASSIGAASSAHTNLILNGGTLQLTGAAATPSMNRNFTIPTGATGTFDITNALTVLTLKGGSTNSTGSLTKIGLGELVMAGTNMHSGMTTVNGGTLAYGCNDALGTGGVTITTGTLDMGSYTDQVGTITLTSGTIDGTGSLGTTGSVLSAAAGTINATITGTNGLTKTAVTGTLTINSTNTFTGPVTVPSAAIAGCVVEVTKLANSGTPDSLGAQTTPATRALSLGSSSQAPTLRYIGTGPSTTDRKIMIAGSTGAGAGAIIENNGGGDLTFTTDLDTVLGVTKTLWLQGSAGGNVVGVITNASTGLINLTKQGGGTWALFGNNSYTGVTTIAGGVLAIPTLANGGLASPIGASPAAAANLVFNGGTLRFIGAPGTYTSDRAVTLTTGFRVDLPTNSTTVSLSGASTFTATTNYLTGANGNTLLMPGTCTLTTGAGFDVANSLTLNLGALATAAGSFTKLGNGMLLLTNTASSRTTGNTTITAGTVKIGASGSPDALGTTGPITFNGGTLWIATDASIAAHAANTNSANSTIILDRATAGNAITNTLGTMTSFGPYTLAVVKSNSVTHNGTACLTVGALTLVGTGTSTFDIGDSAFMTINGAVGPATGYAIEKDGAGTLYLTTASSRNTVNGSTTLNLGALRLGTGNALNTLATAPLAFNGGELSLAVDAATTFNGTAMTLGGGDVVIELDRLTAGTGAAQTNTLGTLSMAGQTVNVVTGALATVGTGGLILGNVTLSGDPTFNIGDRTFLKLGALDDGGTGRTITKSDIGTLILGSAATSLTNGTLQINAGTVSNVINSALGSYWANITIDAGAAFEMGTANGIPDTTIVTNNGTIDMNGQGETLLALRGTGTVTNSATTMCTLQLGPGGLSTVAFTNNGTIDGPIHVSFNGALKPIAMPNGGNTYTGKTAITYGSVTVNTLTNMGLASSLGAPSGANAIIDMGSAASGGTLVYIGPATITDRPLNIKGKNNVIVASGSGPLDFTAANFVTSCSSNNQYLYLSGDNTDTNTIAAAITNGPPTGEGGILGLTKTGAGTWVLSGNSTFSGLTTVSQGKLRVNGSLASPVTVAAGATFDGNGSTTGSFTNQTGGTLAPGTSVGGLTVGYLTLQSGSINNFEISTDGTTNDQIIATGLTVADDAVFHIYEAGTTTTPTAARVIYLIRHNGSFVGTPSALTVAGAPDGYSYVFENDGTWLKLRVGIGQTIWTGALDPLLYWSLGDNWSNNVAPSNGCSLKFNNFSDPLTAVNNLTNIVLTGLEFGDSAGTFTLNGGAVNMEGDLVNNSSYHSLQTVNMPVVAQAGSISLSAANGDMQFNGAISSIGPTNGIAKTGPYTVTLTTSNTYEGVTTISAGVLQMGTNGTTGYVGTNSITITGGALVLDRSDAVTLANSLSGAGAVTNAGSGALTVAGDNSTFAGAVVVPGTVVKVGSTTALGTAGGATVVANGTLDLNGITPAAAEPFTLSGSGVGGNGALLLSNAASVALSGAITLANDASIRSADNGVMALGGGVIGSGNLTLDVDGAGGIMVSNASVNFTGTLVNAGSGSGTSTVYSVIGTNVSVLQNSVSSALTLTNNNMFTNGLTIQAGSVLGTVSNAFGAKSGIITIGAGGSAAATLVGGYAGIFPQQIVVPSGSTGFLAISNTAAANFTNSIALSNNLFVTSGGSLLSLGGGILGQNGNLTLMAGSGGIQLSNATVNFAGSITNAGLGTGSVTIGAVIGSSVGSVVQNSSTSVLSLTNNNAFTGGLTVRSGTVLGSTHTNAFGPNGSTITLGATSGSANAALVSGFTTFPQPINVVAGSTGLLTISNTVATTLGGTISVGNNLIVAQGAALTFTNGFTGAGGSVTFQPNAVGISNLTVALNHAGTITNTGTGAGAVLLSGGANAAGVGPNVTAVVENNVNSPLTISNLTLNTSGTILANNNASGSTILTLKGWVGGTGDLIFSNANAINAYSVSLLGSTVTNIGQVINTGTGTNLIGSTLGATITSVIQNSANSRLTLTNNNSAYLNGIAIKAGSVLALTSANALGGNANVITLGDPAGGSSDATLVSGTALTFAQPITVPAGSSGMLTISNAAATTFSGPITVTNNLIAASGAAALTLSGGVTGGPGGSLTLNAGGAAITIQTQPVNLPGSITNSGAGAFTTTISGGIGANVTTITENSLVSPLTISTGYLTVNSGGTTLANNNAGGSSVLTVSGGVGGVGDLILKNNSVISNGITLNTTTITNLGQVINSGTGTGSNLINVAIGTNVTAVVQNSASSPLTLGAANTYTGNTLVAQGTLRTTVANAIPGGFGKGNVTVNGNWDLVGVNNLINNLTGNGQINNISATMAILTASNVVDSTFSGTLTNSTPGGLRLTKNGPGTLSLTGDLAYGGATIISNGTLAARTFSGTSTVTVVANAVLAPGIESTADGVMTCTNLTVNGSGNLAFEFSSAPTNDQIVVTGTLTLTVPCGIYLYNASGHTAWTTPGTYKLIQYNALGGTNAAAMFCANAQPGMAYTFSSDGTAIYVTIGAQKVWDGEGADTEWGTPANWLPDGALSAYDTLTFSNDVSAQYVAHNGLAADTAFGTITFTNTANSFTLTGNRIKLNGDVLNYSTSPQTLSAPVILDGANRTFNTVAGNITVDTAVGGAANAGLVKSGTNTLTLSSTASDYGGQTVINGGVVAVQSLGGVSEPGSLGQPTSVANGTILIGSYTSAGTLRFAGNGASDSDRQIALAGTTGGVTLDVTGNGSVTLNADVIVTGTGAKVLTLTGSGAGTNTINGTISNASPTSVTKSGAGTWVLNNNNTYTGVTTNNGGTLQVPSLAIGGVASPLGMASAAAANQVMNGGTLQVVGAGVTNTTDRAFTFVASTTSHIDVTNTQATVIISGASPTTASSVLDKQGQGKLVLTATNLHATTTITAGELENDGSLKAVVINGGIYSGTGVSAGITNNGGFLAPGIAGAAGGQLNTTNLALNTGAKLAFEITGTATDTISVVNGSGLTINDATVYLYANGTQTAWTPSPGVYNLISCANWTLPGGVDNMGMGNPVAGFDYTFDYVSPWIRVTIQSASQWDGGATPDPKWTTAVNWYGDAPVSAGNNLVFAGTQNLSPSNDVTADTGFGALSFDSSAGSFTLVGNQVALAGNVQNNSANSQTIAMPVLLDTTDRVVNAASGNITISGVIGEVNGVAGLRVRGAGNTVTLSGANTNKGSMVIDNTTLSVDTLADGGQPSGIGAGANTADKLVLTNATLKYTGATASSDRSFTLADSTTNTIDITTGGTTLTLSGSAASSSGNLIKRGSGTLLLAGANQYTGWTKVAGGTLEYGADNALGTGSLILSNSAVNMNGHADTVGSVLAGTLDGDFSSINGPGTLTSALFNFNGATFYNAGGDSVYCSAVLAGGTSDGTGAIAVDIRYIPVYLYGENTFTGRVNIQSGGSILYANSMANGGVPCSLGASSSTPTNWTFDDAQFIYTGPDASSDRNWTQRRQAKFTVQTPGVTLTLKGGCTNNITSAGTVAYADSGIKMNGPGTLVLDGKYTYGPASYMYVGFVYANIPGTVILNGEYKCIGGSAVSNPPVRVYSGSTFGGTGMVYGVTTNDSGSTINPGLPGVAGGTLRLNRVYWGSGSGTLAFNFNDATNDCLSVLEPNGFYLTSIATNLINLYTEDGVTAWTTNGTYSLIQYNGESADHVAGTVMMGNPVAGKSYTFSPFVTSAPGVFTVTIGDIRVWDGGGVDANWLTDTNWDTDTVPPAGAQLLFAGNLQLANTNDSAAYTPYGPISFSNNAESFVLSGNAIALRSNLVNRSTYTQTLDMAAALDAPQVTINANAGDLTIVGALGDWTNGAAGFVKTGTNALTLSGVSTNTGANDVSNGTLILDGSLTSVVTVHSNATLTGLGTVSAAVTNLPYGKVAPGITGTPGGVLTMTSLALINNGVIKLEFSDTTNDVLDVTDLSIGSGSICVNVYRQDGGAYTNLSTNGVIHFSGSLSGDPANLVVANPAPGLVYNFAANGSWIELAVAPSPIPVVDNGNGAINVTSTDADLVGNLLYNNSEDAWAILYYGTENKSNELTWANSVPINGGGVVGLGGFTNHVSSLTPDTTYYYTHRATNTHGESWAATTEVFITSAVTIDKTYDVYEAASSNGVFTLTRAITATNEALTVAYTIDGASTAVADTNYVALSGIATFAPGSNTVTIQVTPIFDKPDVANKTLIVNLTGGKYAFSASSATMTIFNSPFPVKTWTALGGDGLWSTPANWSPSGVPGLYDAVVFNSTTGAHCSADSVVVSPLGAMTLDAGYTGTVTFAKAAMATDPLVLTLIGDLVVKSGNIRMVPDTAANPPNGKGYTIVAANIAVSNGASLNSDQAGFATRGNGPGALADYYYASSHGGQAGGPGVDTYGTDDMTWDILHRAAMYGSASHPTEVGCGNDKLAYPAATGSGGGALKLVCSGTITVNGRLSADPNLGNAFSGASSGGSLWLTGGGTLQGNGTISAVGQPNNRADGCGGGGGGRIDISEITNNFAGTITSAGGTLGVDVNSQRGQAGSLLLPASAGTGCTMNNFVPYGTNFTFGNSVTFGSCTITNGVLLTLDANEGQNDFHFGSLTIQSGGRLVCKANPIAINAAAGGAVSNLMGIGVNLYVTNLTIEAGGSLNADGAGYKVFNNFLNNGLGAYGGYAGNGGGAPYGTLSNVVVLGSGQSSHGGGAIKLVVYGALTNNGTISANGAGSGNVTGGSGGSLWIDCDSIAGSGVIAANGSTTNGTSAVGGSGGRIHVLYNTKATTNPIDLGNVYAKGGATNNSVVKGGPGTVLVTDRGTGKESLYIVNNGATDPGTYAFLPTNVSAWAFDQVRISQYADLELADGVTMQVSSVLSNAGTFAANGNSTVQLVGTDDAAVYGVNTFANFIVTNAVSRTVRFEPGKINTVNKFLNFYNVTLRSTVEGSQWRLVLDNTTGSQMVSNVVVKDSNASGGQEIDPHMPSSTDLYNNLNWRFAVPFGARYLIY